MTRVTEVAVEFVTWSHEYEVCELIRSNDNTHYHFEFCEVWILGPILVCARGLKEASWFVREGWHFPKSWLLRRTDEEVLFDLKSFPWQSLEKIFQPKWQDFKSWQQSHKLALSDAHVLSLSSVLSEMSIILHCLSTLPCFSLSWWSIKGLFHPLCLSQDFIPPFLPFTRIICLILSVYTIFIHIKIFSFTFLSSYSHFAALLKSRISQKSCSYFSLSCILQPTV